MQYLQGEKLVYVPQYSMQMNPVMKKKKHHSCIYEYSFLYLI